MNAIEPCGVLPDVDMQRVRRLLIIRLSSIGDVVHAIPISAALGQSYPHIEISWLVEEMSAPIVEGNPYVTNLIVIPRARWKSGRWRSPRVWSEYVALLARLRMQQFDLSLDLHGFAKSGLYAFGAGAKQRLGWWRLREGSRLASRPLPRRPESVHRVDWFLDVARQLGADSSRVLFPLAVPQVARDTAREKLQRFGIAPAQAYVIMNPATGDQSRRWGAVSYAALAARIARDRKVPVVLIGSSKDVPLCNRILQLASEGTPQAGIYSLAGKTNLKELAALLEGCCAQVCGDTGSAHICAALGRPVIGLYGPTDPAHAGPWGQDSNVIRAETDCRAGCGDRGCAAPVRSGTFERGSFGNANQPGDMALAPCMASITVDRVFARLDSVLNG